MQLEVYNKCINTMPLKNLLTQGESSVDKPIILLPLTYGETVLSDLTYVIKAVNSKHNVIEQTLEKTINVDKLSLTWTVTKDFTAVEGLLHVAVVGINENQTEIIKFDGGSLFVRKALTGEYAPPADVIEQALLQMHIEVGKAAASANMAQVQADRATLQAENASLHANNAKSSEDDAKLSENGAKNSQTQASKALADLLQMMGVDIATLVGGKIPISQIPSIATTEIYTLSSLTQMNALVAQNGDICIRTDENKSYIFKDTGWVHLASPTDYASRAGHADTATTAESANKINNHRIVCMTQAEYDIAVKDADTIYLVG